jgi:hypothetical protein
MKKLVLFLSAACLVLVAIAATTTSILSGAGGAQSAGPAPRHGRVRTISSFLRAGCKTAQRPWLRHRPTE